MDGLSHAVVQMNLTGTSTMEIQTSDVDQGFCGSIEQYPGLSFDADKFVSMTGEMYKHITTVEDIRIPRPMQVF